MKHLKLLFIALTCYLHATAENFPFRQLPPIAMPISEDLKYLYLDPNGLIWIGTNMGLKSYDGYTMTTLRAGVNSPGLFPSNEILCVTKDHQENLWLGTRNGLVRLNLKTGKTKTYNELRVVIYTLFTAKDGTVWIGTDEGLSRYMSQEDRILTYDQSNSISIMPDGSKARTVKYGVKSITEDRQGNLFLGTWNHSLIRIDTKKAIFYRYPSFNPKASAYSLLLDTKGTLWIGTWGYGLLKLHLPYNTRDPQAEQLPFSASAFNTFYNIIEDPISKKIMASSREGIAIIEDNGKDTEIKTYTSIGGKQMAFSNRIITDGEGNFWVGTANNGIVQFNTHPSPFPQYKLNANDFNTSIHNVSAIYTPDGRHLWISILPFGLALHDMLTGETYVNKQIAGMEDVAQQALGSNFTCFEKRQNGDLWMGNWAGIVVRTPTSKSYMLNKENTDYLAENYITALKQTKNGLLWVGQRSGISIVYPSGKGLLLHPHENGKAIEPCDVRNIAEDSKGNIWLSTNNRGIIRISNTNEKPGKMTYKQYAPSKGNLVAYDITSCMEDHEKRLWAISNSGGLFLYNKEKDLFDPKNKEYMIEGDRILAIAEDRQGNLWLTEDQHLFKLSFANGQPNLTSYGKSDGLENINFAANAITQDGDLLYFNTQNGYFVVDTQHLAQSQKKKFSLMVTNIYIDDEPIANLDSALRAKVSPTEPRYTQKLTIPSSIKKLGVEFAMLAHGNTDYIRYAYKLEGYHDDWAYAYNDQRTAVFQNLPPGTYKLHIRASDGYGQWTKLPYTITIKVLPPWHATWWAYMAYMLFLVGIILLAIEWYKRHLKTKNRLQMQVIFTNITHELLTPLTVIQASIDELRTKSPSFESHYQLMQNNITQATRLLREILEVRKSQAGQLKLLVCLGDMAEFLRYTCENLRPMANNRHNTFNVDIPQSPCIGWFDTDKLEKIVYNLLSNAFKYNKEGGYVNFSLKVSPQKAIIQVEDSGIGISAKKQRKLYTRFLDGDYRQKGTTGTGIGLSLTYDLIKLHHGNIQCKSQQGKGTTFTVSLPICKKAYKAEEIDNTGKPRVVDKQQIRHIQEEITDEKHEEATTDGYRILIVEDNEQLLHIMKQMLTKQYKVLVAKDGEQAWKIIQREELDIVVSDVMMPIMNGIELTRHIKQDPNFSQLPVILLTAMTTDEDRDNAYEHGADEYITKPFKIESLKKRIDNIIENRKRIKERFAAQTNFKVEEQHYSSPDEVFLKKAIELVNQHIDDPGYDREKFANDMGMSSSTLYNKLRALTGQTIVGFINSIRLKKAYQLLEEDPSLPVTELSTKVGFNTPKYFSKCFKDEFGFLPSKWNKRDNNN